MTLTIRLCTGKEIELTPEEWEELVVVIKGTNYVYPPLIYPYYPRPLEYPYIMNGTCMEDKYLEIYNE